MTYQYYYNEKHKDKPLLVLLHPTGGNEKSLVSYGEFLAPESSILSIRGNVDEEGKLRYFKRLGLQQPDLDDLQTRSQELFQFLEYKIDELGYSNQPIIVLGYSNGANMITALNQIGSLFDYSLIAHGRKYLNQELVNHQGKHVFISLGEGDQNIDPDKTRQLAKEYEQAGAEVKVFVHHLGHTFDRSELVAMQQWLAKKGVN